MSKPPPSYLDAKETRPLTEDETRTFMGIMFGMEDTLVPPTELEAAMVAAYGDAIVGSFNIQVMIKRLVAMRPDLLYSPKTVLLCAMLSDRVGVVVQWAYTIVDYNRRHGRPLDFNAWVDCFPMGPPSEKEQERLWDAQKRNAEGDYTDNQIDGRAAWAAAYTEIG